MQFLIFEKNAGARLVAARELRLGFEGSMERGRL